MRKIHAIALVLFALTMIGAQDCWSTAPVGSTNGNSTDGKLFCYTDPPLGCAVICAAIDNPVFTGSCSNVEAGPRTKMFVDDVQAIYDTAAAQGIPVCPAEKIGMAVTSCADGITPVEWPGQDHQVCTPAPAGCPL
jgi:hypothetical protein